MSSSSSSLYLYLMLRRVERVGAVDRSLGECQGSEVAGSFSEAGSVKY